jgi:hypothetical protein
MILQGAATNPILLRDVPRLVQDIETAPDWRSAKEAKALLDELCDEAARAAGAEDGSKLGTLLHTITEYADAGRFPEIQDRVPSELLDDLAAYLVTMRDAGIECPPVWIERILVNPAIDAAGTADRFLRMPEPCRVCGRYVRIGDLKTQKSVDFGWLSIAIQLAGYARADAMLTEEGRLGPMPADLCRCFGIVMHLPVGSGVCTLYEIDLEAGWEAAKLAFGVREFRTRSKAMGWPYRYDSHTPANAREVTQGTAGQSHELFLIRTAPHTESLTALWRELSGKGEWTDEMTALAKARRAELEAA